MPPVAVLAETAAEARRAASALLERIAGATVVPSAFATYLDQPDAPARVILCATRGAAGRRLAFLARAAARILWPAPPADLAAAIGGLRALESAPRHAGRAGSPRSALLLEGPVGEDRALAALAAVAGDGPREWIVESARHVRLGQRRFAALGRAGIRWSALEPVELLAVYAAGPVARQLRGRPWLPRGTPVWITPDRPR